MTTYNVVLFLHILSAILGFGAAAVAHTLLFRFRSASEVRQVREQLPVLHRAERLFPLSAVLLLVWGAYLIHLSGGQITWRDGWIQTAVTALVIVEGVGGAVIGRRSKALDQAVQAAPDGAVDPQLRGRLIDRPIWLAAHFNTAVITATVLLMTAKPSGAVSVLIVAVGAAVGVASALPFVRTSSLPART